VFNNRPVNDKNLQDGIDEVKAIMARRGLAGACMLIAPEETVWTYGMHAPWSAIQPDVMTPLGFRIKASEAVDGKEGAHARIEAAAHTVCQLSDFGAQTMDWMEQLKMMMRRAGIDFEHTPFGGRPVPPLTSG
jgi:hypothetical protein